MPYILQRLPSLSHNPLIPSHLFSVPFSISISQASAPLLSFSFCSLAIDAVLQPGFTSKPPLPAPRWRSADPQVTFFSPYMFHTLSSPRPPSCPGASKTSGPVLGQRQDPCRAPLRLSPIQPPVSSVPTTSNLLPFTQPALHSPCRNLTLPPTRTLERVFAYEAGDSQFLRWKNVHECFG